MWWLSVLGLVVEAASAVAAIASLWAGGAQAEKIVLFWGAAQASSAMVRGLTGFRPLGWQLMLSWMTLLFSALANAFCNMD